MSDITIILRAGGHDVKATRSTATTRGHDPYQMVNWDAGDHFNLTECWGTISGTFNGEKVHVTEDAKFDDEHDVGQMARATFNALEEMHHVANYVAW